MSEFTEKQIKDACKDYVNHTFLFVEPQAHDFDKWWANRNNPTRKVIDLSTLVESGVDCEFWPANSNAQYKLIGPLSAIRRRQLKKDKDYISSNGTPWERCRPRMDFRMLLHSEATVIKGFVAKAYFDSGETLIVDTGHNDIIWDNVRSIKYLSVHRDWVYPWGEAE